MSSIVISPKVIDTVKALPESERKAIVEALAFDIFLGHNPDEILTPFQALLYTMIRRYVSRDSYRANSRAV